MNESMAAAMRQVSHIRAVDLLDIALVAIACYVVLVWIRTSASRAMIAGVLVMVVVHAVAQTFEMHLTAWLLNTGMTVFLIALVVLLQDDLRRAFEWIALWGPFRRRSEADSTSPHIDLLVEGLERMASLKRGILVVLQGNEPIERHLTGGVTLDGRMSVPLLLSVFDPHSPGHDGAIVVEGDRVTSFAVHLPLSQHLSEIRGLGTRHAAALGLSERCDALVLLVSEERGEISVAERGELSMVSPQELKVRIVAFRDRHFPQPKQVGWGQRLFDDALLKTISVLLAAVAWLFVASRAEPAERSFVAPLEAPAARQGEQPRTVNLPAISDMVYRTRRVPSH